MLTAKEQKFDLKGQRGFAAAHFGDCIRVYKLHPGAPTSLWQEQGMPQPPLHLLAEPH